MGQIAAKLLAAGIRLPSAPKPAGLYIPISIVDGRFQTSGVLPNCDGKVMAGQLNDDQDIVRGEQAARASTTSILVMLDEHIQAPDQVQQLHMRVYVAASQSFQSGHLIANAASEMIDQVFSTKHTREAIHVPSLPLNAVCEISLSGTLLAPQ